MTPLTTISILLALAAPSPGGDVRTDTFWSQALGTHKQAVVYLPPSYAREPRQRYPVVYYLHPLGGSEWDWVRRGSFAKVMDSLVAAGAPELIVVMPDGDDGWYTTWNTLGNYASCRRRPPPHEPAERYCVPWPHYDDYIAREVVAHVDSSYRTIPRRASRGIGGAGMGGMGAVSLALAYPDVFAAAVSHSGVLSPRLVGFDQSGAPRYARDIATLRERWGTEWQRVSPVFGSDTIGWAARDPAVLAARAARRSGSGAALPVIWIDAGESGEHAEQARAFRSELEALSPAPRYLYREWPGADEWRDWRTRLPHALAWLATQVASSRESR